METENAIAAIDDEVVRRTPYRPGLDQQAAWRKEAARLILELREELGRANLLNMGLMAQNELALEKMHQATVEFVKCKVDLDATRATCQLAAKAGFREALADVRQRGESPGDIELHEKWLEAKCQA